MRDLFFSINEFRSIGINAPNPFSSETFRGWESLHGVMLSPEEIRLMMDLDKVYRSSLAKAYDSSKPKADDPDEAHFLS